MQSIFLRGQKKNRDRMEYEDIHSTGTELGTDTADGAEMPSTASVPTGAWPCERALPDSTGKDVYPKHPQRCYKALPRTERTRRAPHHQEVRADR